MKVNTPTTKIIAGKYKGKTISLPSLEVTRSSKSRLKESLFNVLQFDIIDKIFIESFAGSGSIGLEAISRDAKRAYFVELNKNSYSILIKNCKAIDMNKCETQLGDTFVQTPNILSSVKNSNDEVILYIDPPFDYRDGMEDIYQKSFKMIEEIENENIFMIIVEHVSTLEIPQTLGKFSLSKTKKFGKSSLSYYKYS
ncbi:16S rRNA (guanine(966)-N(2))-methyltransferase RsmD [Poseidonibacter ostreae]|jgi:16S rRNA (guanine966-N2)-methyltransferase|uniref:16S rRNA (Guanine(966)-N(2))-methyltransferase RsmD n=1 Tax=Poseidonibacter ostreae TaxID=2654171 RepID=A0A6L4WQP2_9BACT|nr:16S rRNA (guanine(966)-N(2))-methyltransferase RsmD [Poseidonibacter ostreae]KAB7884939.1 16S rRNA (guanine(966)-N(2))-methyltransferase RsmD [Poseidonibacter ostreae]KAB7886764.1 16S rRNA (guanine(966)-N(2))-methyltransferase RsmD [Poseidonibacter ostreae]KAB7892978.1 16S rRNA (guanine(966)-N(2))-methyltransferase RsmD [Poseidonibacter ostreae]MAC83212.1 16S rRNA (guanine(966)-N(2))-methyltransferase RsmD [Arcobacter sp.]|tara:strand:+ start:275 stop:865 length:591 start_codon:yes stop_codon:yes gene_type:complete